MCMRTFAKSVLVITAFAVCTRVIGFVFRIFLSRILGAEMLGVYQMAMSIFMILLTVVSSGLPLVLSREVAKTAPQDRKVLHLTIAGLLIGLVASVILCGIILLGQRILGFIFTDQRSLAILVVMLPGLIASSVYAVLRAIWWGEKRFFLLGLTELIEQIARVVLFVLFLGFAFYFTDLAHLSAWSFSGACIISAMVVVIIFIKCAKFSRTPAPRQSYIKPLLKSATPITGVRLLSSLAFPVISVLLPLRLVAAGWSNIEAISQLGVVTGMTFPLLTIPSTVISALATALVPELSTMITNGKWDTVRAQIKTVINFTIFINFIFIPVYIAIGPQIGFFLYADQNSGLYLARSAWAMLPISLSQITNTTLNSMNKENSAIRNYAISAIILFIMIWFMPGIIGPDAVLLGYGLAMALSSVLNIITIRKTAQCHTPDQTLLTITKFVAISVPAFLMSYFISRLGATLPMFLNLTLAGSLACATFFGLCWATNLIILPKKRQ